MNKDLIFYTIVIICVIFLIYVIWYFVSITQYDTKDINECIRKGIPPELCEYNNGEDCFNDCKDLDMEYERFIIGGFGIDSCFCKKLNLSIEIWDKEMGIRNTNI